MQGCFSTTVHFLTLYVPNELRILTIYEMHQPFLHIFCYTSTFAFEIWNGGLSTYHINEKCVSVCEKEMKLETYMYRYSCLFMNYSIKTYRRLLLVVNNVLYYKSALMFDQLWEKSFWYVL